MSRSDRLALQREPDKTFAFVGTVVEDSRTHVTIVTPAGSTTSVPKKGLLFVGLGSLSHFARLGYTEELRRALREAPLAVFGQALIDASAALSGAELRSKLLAATLPADEIDAAWKRVTKTLEQGADVRVSGTGSGKKFRWTGAPETVLGPYLPTAWRERLSSKPEVDDTPADRSAQAPAPIVPVPDRQDAPADATVEATGTPSPTPRDAGDDARPEPAEIPNDAGILLAVLAKALGDDAPATFDELAKQLLATGAALAHTKASDLNQLADVPAEQLPLVQLLMAAVPRQVNIGVTDPPLLAPAIAGEALVSAIAEADRKKDLIGGLARFAEGVFRMTSVGDLPLELVANAFVRVSAGAAERKIPKGLESLADALARRTAAADDSDWDKAEAAVPSIARAMSRLSLDPTGPRARFLAALFTTRPKLLDNELFWMNADLPALHAAAGGELRRALQDPSLEDAVVRPVVQAAIGSCTTRHGLGELISLRASFAKFISPDQLSEALERVSQNDPIARDWAHHVRRSGLVSNLREEVGAARRRAAGADENAADAITRLERVSADLESARDHLRRAVEHNANAGEAQLRQAKLDVLRALATLSNHVAASPTAMDDPALLQRIDFTLRREGLVRISDPGETVSYDPALHDSQGQHVNPGSPVSVGRAGYTYDAGNESVVLAKALVTAI